MTTTDRRSRVLLTVGFLVGGAVLLATPAARAQSVAAAAQVPFPQGRAAMAGVGGVPRSAYSQLRWRLVGPFRGGWATAVEGVPSKPGHVLFRRGRRRHLEDGRCRAHLAVAGFSTARPPRSARLPSRRPTRTRSISAPASRSRATTSARASACSNRPMAARIGRRSASPTHAISAASGSIRNNANIVLVGAQGHFFGPSADRGALPLDGRRQDLVAGAEDRRLDRRRRYRERSDEPETASSRRLGSACNIPGRAISRPSPGPGARSTNRPMAARPGHKSGAAAAGRRPRWAASGLPSRIRAQGTRIYAAVDSKEAGRPLSLRRRRRALGARERFDRTLHATGMRAG